MLFKWKSHRKIFLPIFLVPSVLAETKDSRVSFHLEVRPIFEANCYGCHQPAKQQGDYLMTEFDDLLAGGETGKSAVVPGKPDQSHLLRLIKVNEMGEVEMPKGKKSKPLRDSEVSLIEQWIREGANDDSPKEQTSPFTMDRLPVYERLPLIRTLSFSPDGQHLAQNGFHEVLVASTGTGKIVARLVGLSERIESVAFSPDGTFLAVAGGNPGRSGEIQVWEWRKQKLLLSKAVTFDTLYGVSWSPDGKSIAFGASDAAVRVIDARTGESLVYMAGHNDWVRGTVFSLDGKSVFSVSRDKTVKQTEVATERLVGNVTTHTPGILNGGQNAIAVHPKRKELLVGGADGKAKLFRQATKAAPAGGGNPNQIREFKQQLGRIFSVCFDSQGELCFAGSSLNGRGEVRCFDTMDGKQLWSKTFEQSPVYAISLKPGDGKLAIGGYDGRIRLLSVASGEMEREFVLPPVGREGAKVDGPDLNKPYRFVGLLAGESLPEDSQVKSLAVQPERITLRSSLDYVQFLVTADLGNGVKSDVTRMVSWSVPPEFGSIDNRGLFVPSKNGEVEIMAKLGANSCVVRVSVSGIPHRNPPDFVSEVNPIISKLGCNSGTCHGSKDGKNGFKLSLRGYDALYDLRSLTDDMASRRVNVAAPERSLMLLKATGRVPHEGGKLMMDDSRYHRVLRAWIGEGAVLGAVPRRVRAIKLFPENPVIEEIGATQQFRVVAYYDDGMVKDVTREAFVTSGNGEVAENDDLSLMTTLRRGEAPILARFEGRYDATTLTVMGARSDFVWKEQIYHNRIDQLVAQKWKRMKILPSGMASDLDFLRRVYLDLTGLPPEVGAISSFSEDKRESRKKRDEVIDELIGNEEFVEHWSNKWADMLQVNGKFLGREGATALRDWIEGEIRKNTPYDEFVRKVLTAAGSNKKNPPASYFKILRTPEDTMENTTHLFLATRFNCNKCHDHPFERWTQDQYYEMAAHFAQFKLEKDPLAGKETIGKTAVERAKPLYEIVKDVPKGGVRHERTGAEVAPDFPYPAKFEDKPSFSRRERLAAWMTSADNRYFARSYVNRLWGYLFGKGIIEPIDDIRAGNPPSNPELLDYLEKEFIESGFDVRHILRMICRSRTYQLSVDTNPWNEDDAINFSHAMPRRLSAETLLDAVYAVTGSKSKFPGVAPGSRAASLPDVGIGLPDGFLNTFGRPARETSCECERSGELQLGPIMALVSGPTVNDAISDPLNAIAKLAEEEVDDGRLINRLFLRILNRPASKDEISSSLNLFSGRIESDHLLLADQLDEEESKIKFWLAEQEKKRTDSIAKARKELERYKSQTAEEVRQANEERNAKIAEAQRALDEFDRSLPQKIEKWESDYFEGKSIWVDLDLSDISSEMPGVKFEKQKDGSVFVGGRSSKGDYLIEASTDKNRITGIRLEAMKDDRLPRKGPGRSPNDGNFVLTELEVVAGPTSNLAHWAKEGEWKFSSSTDLIPWKVGPKTKILNGNKGIVFEDFEEGASFSSSEFYHVGPFVGLGFDQEGEPEKETIFDPDKKFSYLGRSLEWRKKPEWKEGELYARAFSAEESSNYLLKLIESKHETSLPLSLGSDDGIKVFLNGRRILSRNVGRGAAPDQEKLTLSLKKGRNIVLLKIHNGVGTSGFYYNSGSKERYLPSIELSQKFAPGSYVLQFSGGFDTAGFVKVRWGSESEESQTIKVERGEGREDYRIHFTARKEITKIQFFSPSSSEISSIGLFGNGLPTTLKFENELSTFSQSGYPVASAVDGKLTPQANGWAISPQMGRNHFASFQVKTPVSFKGPTQIRIIMKQRFQSGQHSLGRFRVSVTDAPKPISYGIAEELSGIFAITKAKRSPQQKQKLADGFKKSDPHRVRLAQVLSDANRPLPVDSKLRGFENSLSAAEKPLSLPPEVTRLRRAISLSEKQLANRRIIAAQDLAWALINTPSFLFNR